MKNSHSPRRSPRRGNASPVKRVNPVQPAPPLALPRPAKIWRPQFGIGGMLLVMLVFSFMAAAASYLVRALQGGRGLLLPFVLFTLTAPVFLVIAVSLVRAILRWRFRR